MAATRRTPKVRTLPRGTPVEWHYRSAIGHGTVAGVDKLGTSHATTRYKIREHDHHPGEPAYVYHYGRALRRARSLAHTQRGPVRADGASRVSVTARRPRR